MADSIRRPPARTRTENPFHQSAPANRTKYEYDGNGRLTTLLHAIDSGGGDPTIIAGMTYGYDAVGNRMFSSNSAMPDRSERYGHDNLNRLTVMDRGELNTDGSAVTTPLSHPVLNSNQQWADLDRRGNWLDYRWALTQGEAPDQTSTTYQQTRTANGVNEYTDLVMTDPSGLQISYAPIHDSAGNLTFDPLAPNVGAAASAGQRFVYDEQNRVVRVQLDNGNHDPNAPTIAAYEYDALGRRVNTIEYVDAATGNTLTTPRKTRHIYAGAETIEEYNVGAEGGCDAGVLIRSFIWGDPGRFPEPIAMIRHESGHTEACDPTHIDEDVDTVYHYLHDALGSVIGLTDASGEIVERYTYDPYGKPFIERWDAAANDGAGGWETSGVGGATIPAGGLCYSALGNPFMWTGQRYDAGTGLYGFPCRSYSPSLGRWLQRDPAGFAGSLNLYLYSLANPMRWSDPFGLFPWSTIGDIAGGIADGVGEIASGIYQTARHPINTAVALGSQVHAQYVVFREAGHGVLDSAAGAGAATVVAGMGAEGAYNAVEGKDRFGTELGLRGRVASGTVAGVQLAGSVAAGAEALNATVGGGGLAARCSASRGASAAARTNAELVEEIGARADAWGTRQGLTGTAREIGTAKHVYARDLLRRYQSRYGDRGLVAERSFLNRNWVEYGTSGSVRLDVLDVNTNAVWEYKFGVTPMSPAQEARILMHGPRGVSLTELRYP